MLINISVSTYLEDTHAGEILPRYRGKGYYVHFGKTQKLGTNPLSGHGDFQGIYFYPVDWVLDNASYQQYAMTLKFFTVVRIDKTGTTGITFQSFTGGDLIRRLTKTRLVGAYHTWLTDVASRVEPKNEPAVRLYHFYRYLKQLPDKRFNVLKGIDWIEDLDGGYFNRREPCQILVRNPKIFKLVCQGQTLRENPAQSYAKAIRSMIPNPSVRSNSGKSFVQYTVSSSIPEVHPFKVNLYWNVVRQELTVTSSYTSWDFTTARLFKEHVHAETYNVETIYRSHVLDRIRASYKSYTMSTLVPEELNPFDALTALRTKGVDFNVYPLNYVPEELHTEVTNWYDHFNNRGK